MRRPSSRRSRRHRPWRPARPSPLRPRRIRPSVSAAGADRRPPLRRHVVPHRSPQPAARARRRCLSGRSTARSARRGGATPAATPRSRACRAPKPGRATAIPACPRCRPPGRCHRSTGRHRRAAHSRADCASAVANNDAPAPPRPPITAMTAPPRSPSPPDSAASRQRRDEFGLVGGQVHHVLGAHGDRGLPIGGPRFAAAEHDDVSAPRQRGSAQRPAPAASSSTADAPVQACRLGGCATWTTATPAAAATRSTSSRIAGSATIARTPLPAFISPQCGRDATAFPCHCRHLWTRPDLWHRASTSGNENAIPQLRRTSPPIRPTKRV